MREWVPEHFRRKWRWAQRVAMTSRAEWVSRVTACRDSSWQAAVSEYDSFRPRRPSTRRWMKFEDCIRQFCRPGSGRLADAGWRLCSVAESHCRRCALGGRGAFRHVSGSCPEWATMTGLPCSLLFAPPRVWLPPFFRWPPSRSRQPPGSPSPLERVGVRPRESIARSTKFF